MQKTVTRYETMIRHDEAGKFKGGHHIDIVRWLPGEGETAEDMPPPRLTDAIPLTVEDLKPVLAQDAASALAGFSELKGRELGGRVALAQAEEQIAALSAEVGRLTAERDAALAQVQAAEPLQTFERPPQEYGDIEAPAISADGLAAADPS